MRTYSGLFLKLFILIGFVVLFCSFQKEAKTKENSYKPNIMKELNCENQSEPVFAKDSLVRPLAQKDVLVRGNKRHPCINITAQDIVETRKRIERYPWAKKRYETIIKHAEPWLRESDQYWLSFLPKHGEAYAYGFTGCPICGSSTGSWDKALCSWSNPDHVRCQKGHVLPDADHPDDGNGYVSADGKIYYFVGQFNAWATEQWRNALPALGQAYLLTGDERYAERGLLFLDALASIYKEATAGSWDYPSNPLSGRLARPFYQVARSLVIFADAYDWLYNSLAAEKKSLRPGMTRRQNIEQCLLLDGAYYCYANSWRGNLTNGHADYLRGVLAVGCLLDIPEYIDAAINGPFSINTMLANNIDRDGQYYETAHGYSMHSLKLYLTFAEPFVNLRNKEYPNGVNLYDDPRLQAAITLPELRTQIAGRHPNYGDCNPETTYRLPSKKLFSTFDYECAESLFARVSSSNKRKEYGRILNFLANDSIEKLRSIQSFDWLFWHANKSSVKGSKVPSGLMHEMTESWFSGTKGVALMREDDHAALLRYGVSVNHGDYDDLGLNYYGSGYELSYDIGYGLSSTHVQTGWANSTVSHALVTVNEKNQIDGCASGGSLLGFSVLPSVKFVDADSPLSYTKEGVSVYRRSLSLVNAGYLVDCFHVEGGNKHDYGFGSLGTSLEPFGVQDIKQTQGSLAEGFAFGEIIENDGNIKGYANKPYWNPPPGNGYCFFFDVRKAKPTNSTWGGKWTITDSRSSNTTAWNNITTYTNEHLTHLRMHVVGDAAEPVFANAPGIYPNYSLSSYVMARRSGENLKSTFLAVYEPYSIGENGPSPRLERVERIGEKAIAIYRLDGKVDILLYGTHLINSVYGAIEFKGDFVYITGDGKVLQRAESSGAGFLSVGGKVLIKKAGEFVAKVIKVNAQACTVELDVNIPVDVTTGQTAIFSNPAWTRTSGYSIAKVEGNKLELKALDLSLGIGRVEKILSDGTVLCDIPHEYARTTKWAASRFFEGKMLIGRQNGEARITSVVNGKPMKISVKSGSTLKKGEVFDYMDLSPGDDVRIALPQIWTSGK